MASSRLLPQFFGRKRKANIRVTGLVKAMSLAREQLTTGIPVDGVDEFCQFVTRTLANVDHICRVNLISTKDLPAPSFRAYQYLKQIDLKNIPIVDEPNSAQPSIRISHLNAAVRHIQVRMMETVRETLQEKPGTRKRLREVQNLIAQQSAYLQLMLKKKKATIHDLPIRSTQSALWLMYLNEETHYQNVIGQLSHCSRIYENMRTRNRANKKMPPLAQMTFEFTPMAALYRWRIKDGLGQMSLHPGFLSVDEEILGAILSSAILRRNTHQSLKIRQAASTPAFLTISRQLEGEVHTDDAVGQFYDLNEMFDEVNRQYFNNRCQRPKIKWGTRLTRRKFGMYLPSSDTVVVSLSLDQQYVPRYVVAFILYHELLHKQLGMKDTAQRQIAHTTKFRQLEKQFSQYDEAQRFLEKLARSH